MIEIILFILQIDASPDVDQNRCPICLEQYSKEVAILPCRHQFHPKCIARWAHSSNRCPICRKELQIQSNLVINPFTRRKLMKRVLFYAIMVMIFLITHFALAQSSGSHILQWNEMCFW